MANSSPRGAGKKGQASTGPLKIKGRSGSVYVTYEEAHEHYLRQKAYFDTFLKPLMEKKLSALEKHQSGWLKLCHRCLTLDCTKTALRDPYYCDDHRPR